MKRGIVWLSAALSACAPAPIAPPPRPAPIAARPAPAAPPPAAAAPAATARAPEDTGNPPIRRSTRWNGPNVPGEEKVRQAEQARTAVVKQLFAAAGVAFPPKSM